MKIVKDGRNVCSMASQSFCRTHYRTVSIEANSLKKLNCKMKIEKCILDCLKAFVSNFLTADCYLPTANFPFRILADLTVFCHDMALARLMVCREFAWQIGKRSVIDDLVFRFIGYGFARICD